MEHAPRERRGRWGAWPQFGAMGGVMLSSGTVLALSQTLTNRQFMAWGWRVPFLASGVLLLVGLFVRLRVTESPVFRRLAADGVPAGLPVVEAVRQSTASMLRVGGMHLMVAGFATTLLTFCIPYGIKHVGFSRTQVLQIVFLATVIVSLLSPFTAGLSDRFGRRRVYVAGTAAGTVGVFVSFLLFDVGRLDVGIAGILCLVLPIAVTFQVQGAWFPELFPAASRVTGAGLGSQLATIVVGGPAPAIATALLARGGGRPWWVAGYLCTLALVSMTAALLTPETRPVPGSTDPEVQTGRRTRPQPAHAVSGASRR
jgi:MFS family permease